MNFRNSFLVLVFPVFLGSLLTTSCKENTIVSADVVPAIDNIRVFGTDTLTLLTKSVIDDSVVTSEYIAGLNSFMGVGHITADPFFGKTSAEFYFQVRPPQDNYFLDQTKYAVDSAVLILPYSGFCYGDTTFSAGTMDLKAFRLTEDLSPDSAYYAHSPSKSASTTPFASSSVHIRTLVSSIRDSVKVGGVNKASHVRMKVDDMAMREIINNSGGSNFANTAAFVSYFKGVQIRASTGGNTIAYFRLNGDDNYSTACLLYYYHTINSGGAITDTLTVAFPFDAATTGTKTAFFNRIVRDYPGTPAAALFASTATSDNTVIIQNLPGAALEVVIPNVAGLPSCVVNKAELVINQIASPLDVLFGPPDRLYPQRVTEAGSRVSIADRYPLTSLSPLYFIDGNLRLAAVDGKVVNQYVINFPRELQNAINEKRKELRLRINGTQTYYGAYRLTAAGGNYSRPGLKMKLNIVYTKL